MNEPSSVLRIWLQRLKSTDPAERETSIKELELLGDSDALPGLAEVFATDTDPALRALAQSAGKTIYYGAIQREINAQGPSEEERRRAAEILAKADAKKSKNKRQR